MSDLISVVVPLYNYEQYIAETIESVQKQTYSNWELIIVDDCSKDKSRDVVRPYLCSNIKLVEMPENKGYSTAKNEGIVNSSGRYIVMLDADDMLSPKSLEYRLNFLKKHPKKSWVHGKAYEFSNTKPYEFIYRKRKAIRRLEKILKTKNYSNLWESIHAQTVMAERRVYEKVGLYEESLRSMSDKEMWARMINNVGIPGYVNKFVAYYRRHSKQMHVSKWKLKRVDKMIKQVNKLVKSRRKGQLDGIRRLER